MYTVKFSPETIKILENFANINPGILFRPGTTLATMSPASQSVLARVEIKEKFETEFGLYNLSAFLATLKGYVTPDIEVHDKYLRITEGNKSSIYGFTSPALIVFPPEVALNMQPKEDTSYVSFDLAAEFLPWLNKQANASQQSLKERALFADGKKLILKALDSTNEEANITDIILADCDKIFNLIFKEENLPLLDGDYKVDIFKDKRTARFKGPIEYFVKYEMTSTI